MAMSPSFIQRQWSLKCQTARSHADLLSQGGLPEYRELILRETEAFCQQPPPKTHEDLMMRHCWWIHLLTKIDAIIHAEIRACMYPSVADEILRVTREFCDQIPLGDTLPRESITLASKIGEIAYPATMVW